MKVHEFGVRRSTLSDEELVLEQRTLQENIFNSTINVSPSALQEQVIHLLENSLNALLTLMEQVKAKKKETNND